MVWKIVSMKRKVNIKNLYGISRRSVMKFMNDEIKVKFAVNLVNEPQVLEKNRSLTPNSYVFIPVLLVVRISIFS